jgi:hypothetical protein
MPKYITDSDVLPNLIRMRLRIVLSLILPNKVTIDLYEDDLVWLKNVLTLLNIENSHDISINNALTVINSALEDARKGWDVSVVIV